MKTFEKFLFRLLDLFLFPVLCVLNNQRGDLSVSGVQALTTKGIEADGGVRDAVWKNHAWLDRLKKKQKTYSGEKLTIPFEYYDDSQTNGGFYQGAEALTLDIYDPMTELAFELIEIQETLVITHRDLAKNKGRDSRLKLLESRLATMEKAMRQKLTKGAFSDGTAATGMQTTKQFPGLRAFMKETAVNYGGIQNSDVSVHVAYINDASGSNRALTTALHQNVLGGCSEGEERPTLAIMPQGVMNPLIELIKPNQRTTREDTLDNQGHAKNTLVYSGLDHIVDNLHPANRMSFINEKHVVLYTHPDYDMTSLKKDGLETMDAILRRLFWKGVLANGILRFSGQLQDITES